MEFGCFVASWKGSTRDPWIPESRFMDVCRVPTFAILQHNLLHGEGQVQTRAELPCRMHRQRYLTAYSLN
eukprot:1686597-Karenia_brevis.AAC.1